MQHRPVALVTGGNQGIGLQIGKELHAQGFTVLVGSRDLQRGRLAAAAIGAHAHALQLDVTDAACIQAAAEHIGAGFGRLDVLVNNAAIAHAGGQQGLSVQQHIARSRPSVVALDEVKAVWETNVFGVLAVTQALLPLLRQAPAARIVNVSSSVGSLALNADAGYAWRAVFGPGYPASKTALNALTLALAIELEPLGIKVNACCPGFTSTQLNPAPGGQDVALAAREPVRLALLAADGPTGTFTRAQGESIPW